MTAGTEHRTPSCQRKLASSHLRINLDSTVRWNVGDVIGILDYENLKQAVMPAKAGIHRLPLKLDSSVRWNDEI